MKQVAWIVGGVKGLGVMVAKLLAEEGYDLALSYRSSREEAHELVEELKTRGCSAILCQGDAEDSTDVSRMAQEIIRYYGRIDTLVCAAGPFIFQPKKLIDYTNDEWHKMVNGNLSSFFYCVKEVLPTMRKSQFGRVITFGFSEVDRLPAWDGYGAYAAAKAGLASLTRTLSKEEAKHGITVNMVCPGDIRDPYKESTIACAKREKERVSPMGRAGSGEDIARVIRFLVHPDSDFITGAIIPVTGGFINV